MQCIAVCVLLEPGARQHAAQPGAGALWQSKALPSAAHAGALTPPRCGRYLNALQTNAQHLLRYLAVAVVVNKRRRNVLKELIRVVEQQVRTYPTLTALRTSLPSLPSEPLAAGAGRQRWVPCADVRWYAEDGRRAAMPCTPTD